MANASLARLGPLNGASDGSWEQENANFLQVFSGEVLTAFETATIFKALHRVRTIDHGKSASFPFSWTVTAPDVNVGWVINSATATYEITGIPGTPILSSPVYSQTSEHPGPIPGITPGGTPELPGGTFDPDKLPKDPDGGTSLVPVLDPDGKPVLDPDGKPVIAPPITTLPMLPSGML